MHKNTLEWRRRKLEQVVANRSVETLHTWTHTVRTYTDQIHQPSPKYRQIRTISSILVSPFPNLQNLLSWLTSYHTFGLTTENLDSQILGSRWKAVSRDKLSSCKQLNCSICMTYANALWVTLKRISVTKITLVMCHDKECSLTFFEHSPGNIRSRKEGKN